MVRSLQCLITGTVQGVFLRSWIHDQAVSLGLKGWVRNVAEGKIEVLAQGGEDACDALKERLYKGSPMSRVEKVDCKWIEYDKEYENFEIRS